ncbi:ABC transporter permease [Consotaella aegiceratis]|uniref:ABC transporter permease n=1 Tax=Consotaella aegiceratis TaxID=3097961 RepID=UPI002F411B37
MIQYALLRTIYAIPILLGVSIVTFGLLFLQPGNPVEALLPLEAPQDVINAMKVQLGLDAPVPVQYIRWLLRTLHGDLGLSLYDGTSVAHQIGSALFNTLMLAVPAALLAFSVGIALGLIAGYNRNNLIDRASSALAILGVSLPQYWVAIVLVALFSVYLNWLPAAGMAQADGVPRSFSDLQNMILPIVALALVPAGVVARVVRAAVLDILALDFIQGLEAKGLRPGRVLLHVMRNATSAALAVMGLQFGYLLGGSILIETVFNWPGSGQLLNLAIFRRDIPMLQGTVVVIAGLFVVVNLGVDLLQAMIDPRMRR